MPPRSGAAGGSDLRRFSELPKLQRSRARVLAKLREDLRSPQPAATTVRRRIPAQCDWRKGELVGFRRACGTWLTLYVREIAVTEDGDHYPEVCILDIPFERAHEVAASTAVRDIPGTAVTGKNCFRIFGLKKRDRNSDRIQRSGIIVPHIEAVNAQHSSRYVSWKHFDIVLTRWFGS